MSIKARILLVDDESAIVEAPADRKNKAPALTISDMLTSQLDRRPFLRSLYRGECCIPMLLLKKVGRILERVLTLDEGVYDLTITLRRLRMGCWKPDHSAMGKIGKIITLGRLEGCLWRFEFRPPFT